MFLYPEINEHIPIAEQRRFALIRRADKLISWLQRPEYATYENDQSTDHLIKLINLITYALEMSLPDDKWSLFKRKFININQMLLGVAEDDEIEFEPDEKANYEKTVTALLDILQNYKTAIV